MGAAHVVSVSLDSRPEFFTTENRLKAPDLSIKFNKTIFYHNLLLLTISLVGSQVP